MDATKFRWKYESDRIDKCTLNSMRSNELMSIFDSAMVELSCAVLIRGQLRVECPDIIQLACKLPNWREIVEVK